MATVALTNVTNVTEQPRGSEMGLLGLVGELPSRMAWEVASEPVNTSSSTPSIGQRAVAFFDDAKGHVARFVAPAVALGGMGAVVGVATATPAVAQETQTVIQQRGTATDGNGRFLSLSGLTGAREVIGTVGAVQGASPFAYTSIATNIVLPDNTGRGTFQWDTLTQPLFAVNRNTMQQVGLTQVGNPYLLVARSSAPQDILNPLQVIWLDQAGTQSFDPTPRGDVQGRQLYDFSFSNTSGSEITAGQMVSVFFGANTGNQNVALLFPKANAQFIPGAEDQMYAVRQAIGGTVNVSSYGSVGTVFTGRSSGSSAVVPEAGTVALMGAGLLGFAGMALAKRRP